jgi:hypothetical protein
MDAQHSPIGSSFDSFLEEEGIKDEVHAIANARVDAWLGKMPPKAMDAKR